METWKSFLSCLFGIQNLLSHVNSVIRTNVYWVLYALYMGFPGDSVVKNPLASVGDVSSIAESGRSPRKGKSNPLQYSCLENPMNRGAWWGLQSMGLQRSQTWLRDYTTTALYRIMAFFLLSLFFFSHYIFTSSQPYKAGAADTGLFTTSVTSSS